MLYEYHLTNFKAFGETQVIPLRPITLVYGPNSAGKSSIIQSLLMLKQTLQEAESPDTLLLPRGSFVDLGNYHEFIHRHDEEQVFEFKFLSSFDKEYILGPDCCLSEESKEYLTDFFDTSSVMGLGMAFRSYQQRVVYESVNLYINDDDNFFSALSLRPSDSNESQVLKISEINPEHFLWKHIWKKVSDTLLDTNGLFKDFFDKVEETLSERYDSAVRHSRNPMKSLHDQLEAIQADINNKIEQARVKCRSRQEEKEGSIPVWT